MPADYSPAFVEVVAECQQMIHDLEVRGASTDQVRAVEKAVDMAIERRHSDKPKDSLLSDVLRNGRFSARRSRERERDLAERYAEHQLRISTGKARIPGEFIAAESPHSAARGQELIACLVDEAGRCGTHGERVLAGLLAGETVSTTAQAAGVSTATVNRVIRRLRQSVVAWTA